MSRSPSPREQSPDESGYLTHIPRRRVSDDDDYDPSEHSDPESEHAPERSVSLSPEPAPPRARATARMSVRPPVREVFSIPRRDEAGPSQPRDRRVSPPPVAHIPPPPPPVGMTPTEFSWVASMSRNIRHYRLVLNYHDDAIETLQESITSNNGMVGGLIGMVGESNQLIEGILGDLADTRRVVADLRFSLSVVRAFVVVLIAWLATFVQHY